MKNVFGFIGDALEWLHSKRKVDSPISAPPQSPDQSARELRGDEKWFEDLVNAEKAISKAAARGMHLAQYRDFVMGCIDNVMLDHGAQTIEDVGVPYDPLRHRPSTVMEVPDGMMVSGIVSPGVMIKERVLRRAKVEISKER